MSNLVITNELVKESSSMQHGCSEVPAGVKKASNPEESCDEDLDFKPLIANKPSSFGVNFND